MVSWFFPPADNRSAIAHLMPRGRAQRIQHMRWELFRERWAREHLLPNGDQERLLRATDTYFCEDVSDHGLLKVPLEHYEDGGRSALPGGADVQHRDILAWLKISPAERELRRDCILSRYESDRSLGRSALAVAGIAFSAYAGLYGAGGSATLGGAMLGVGIGAGTTAAYAAHSMRAQVAAANADLYLKKMAC